LLFHSYVDVKTRVFRIQVDESDVLDTRGGTRHVPVRMRVLVPRVGVINDQSGHAAKFIPLTKEFRVMGPDSENEPDPMKTAVLVMTGFLTLDGRIALQISQWSEHAQQPSSDPADGRGPADRFLRHQPHGAQTIDAGIEGQRDPVFRAGLRAASRRSAEIRKALYRQYGA
jgi:hypothetical protein